jgi:hypothetical protein
VIGRAGRDVIPRLLVLLAVGSSYAAAAVLLLFGDGNRHRLDFLSPLAGLVQIACCMTAVWLMARRRGARSPLLWSLLGILGLAGLGVLFVVVVVRRWVQEARDALRSRHATHGG